MREKIVGREQEIKRLENYMASAKSEFIAISSSELDGSLSPFPKSAGEQAGK